MSITDEQLKGNWGEQYIAANLASQGCFIRHVTQGHDSGIDLYCETTRGGIPFLHFGCQVKTSKKWKGKKKHILLPKPTCKKYQEYWLKQPVPVFIFLVPDLRDAPKIPYYICSARDLLCTDKKVKSRWKIESPNDLKELPNDLKEFLNKDLIYETILWDLKDGKVSYLKTPKPEYTVQFLGGQVHKYEKKVQENLCRALWRLSEDILSPSTNLMDLLNKPAFSNEEQVQINNAKPYMKALKILAVSKNDTHHYNNKTIGVYYELEGEFDKSLDYYKKALGNIESDPEVNRKSEEWKCEIKTIKQHIKRVESKINH